MALNTYNNPTYFLDIVNALWAFSIVFIVFYAYKVPKIYYFVILGHIGTVFLTNNFLFSPSYMPDQFRYIDAAIHIRENLDFFHYSLYDKSITVSTASLFFALFPIPILNSVFSIALINSMVFAFLFIYLYKKKILIGNAIWFYLLYPSFALYAAIGTRDTLILAIMVLSIYQLYKGKTLVSVLIATPLLLIKFQNFFIFILSFFIYKIIDKKKLISYNNFFKILLIVFLFLFFSQYIPIEGINALRYSMFIEDGGNPDFYIPLINYTDIIIASFQGFINMLLKPFPWESHNALQLIQSFENIIVFYVIFKLFISLKDIPIDFKYFLSIYFIVAMMVYGTVIFNFGTVARYKYTFVVVFIIFSIKILAYKKRI